MWIAIVRLLPLAALVAGNGEMVMRGRAPSVTQENAIGKPASMRWSGDTSSALALAEFCDDLRQFMDLASRDFPGNRGQVKTRHPQTGQPVSWVSTLRLSGATNCFIYPRVADFPGLVQCEMGSDEEDTKLEGVFNSTASRVAACLPAPLWNRTDRKRSTAAGRSWSANFERAQDGSAPVSVNLVPPNPYMDKSAVVISFSYPIGNAIPVAAKTMPISGDAFAGGLLQLARAALGGSAAIEALRIAGASKYRDKIAVTLPGADGCSMSKKAGSSVLCSFQSNLSRADADAAFAQLSVDQLGIAEIIFQQ